MKTFGTIFAVTLFMTLLPSSESLADKQTVYITGGGNQAVIIKKGGSTVKILPKDGGKFGTDKFDPPDDRFKHPNADKYKLPDKYKAPDGYKLPENIFIQQED